MSDTSHAMNARDGFALPATLLAMFVIGAIVTGGFYVSSQEHEASVSTDLGTLALHAAEYGIEERLSVWKNADLDELNEGTVYDFGPFTVQNGSGAGDLYMTYVMPLGGAIYMIQSEGRVIRGRHSATRRVARLVRTSKMELPYQSAMSIYGELAAGGNSLISGYDQCSGDAVPGVMAADDALVTGVEKNANEDRIVGVPAVDEDADILENLNAFDLDPLIASATHTYVANENPDNMYPTTYEENGETFCDLDDKENWGHPTDETHACGDHYPVIHVDGNFKLTTGIGQGILIVDGDLELAGNFEFSGVVIVTGNFKMVGTGLGTGKINGTVIAKGGGEIDTDNTTSGNAQVEYNSCEIENAFRAALRVKPFGQRGWMIDPPPVRPTS